MQPRCQRIDRLCLLTPAHTFKYCTQEIGSVLCLPHKKRCLVERCGKVLFFSGDFITGEGGLHQHFCLMNYFSQFLFNLFISIYFTSEFSLTILLYTFIPEIRFLTLQHTLSLRNPADKCQPFDVCRCHDQHNRNIMSFSSVQAPSLQIFLSSRVNVPHSVCGAS